MGKLDRKALDDQHSWNGLSNFACFLIHAVPSDEGNKTWLSCGYGKWTSICTLQSISYFSWNRIQSHAIEAQDIINKAITCIPRCLRIVYEYWNGQWWSIDSRDGKLKGPKSSQKIRSTRKKTTKRAIDYSEPEKGVKTRLVTQRRNLIRDQT